MAFAVKCKEYHKLKTNNPRENPVPELYLAYEYKGEQANLFAVRIAPLTVCDIENQVRPSGRLRDKSRQVKLTRSTVRVGRK